MYVWNTVAILSDKTGDQAAALIEGATSTKVSDLYFYMNPLMYAEYETVVSYFIKNATSSSIRVWALDGDRSYIPSPQLMLTGE